MKINYYLIFFSLCFSFYLFTMENFDIETTIQDIKKYVLICYKDDLYDALREKSLIKIKKIVKENPSFINEKLKDKNTLLHEICDQISCTKSCYNLTYYLIQKGVNVNAQNEFGETPLHFACFNDDVTMIKLLIKNKANTQLADYCGSSAYNILLFPCDIRKKLSKEPLSANVKSTIYHALHSESSITQFLIPDIINKIKDFYRQLYIAPLLSSPEYWIWEPICLETNKKLNIIDNNPERCCLRILICYSLEEKLKINETFRKK